MSSEEFFAGAAGRSAIAGTGGIGTPAYSTYSVGGSGRAGCRMIRGIHESCQAWLLSAGGRGEDRVNTKKGER